MCGRYTIFMLDTDLDERFGATPTRPLEPRYNAAPGQDLPVITNDSPDRVALLRWGLIPRWADDEEFAPINARAETLREKPTFRDPFEQRRCLVLADGFYEWTETDDGKQPYRITLADEGLFAMAGLWERWVPDETQSDLDAFADADTMARDGDRDGDGDGNRAGDGNEGPVVSENGAIETFAIVTTEPNDVVGTYHDRMPVVLPQEGERRWLEDDPDDLGDLLGPYEGPMNAYPVSKAVNNPANDSPDVIVDAGAN